MSHFITHWAKYVLLIKKCVPCIARVKSSYPEEAGYVDKRKKELDKLWKDLKVHLLVFMAIGQKCLFDHYNLHNIALEYN